MLAIYKIAYLTLVVVVSHRYDVKAKDPDPSAVHQSSSSFVIIKESGSPDQAHLKQQGSQSATSYQYTHQSGSSGVDSAQSHGSIDTPTRQSSGSYQYGSKRTYTSSGGVQRTDHISSGQRNPSPGVQRSSTAFVQIKEGGSDDTALLQQQGSKSATSYQYTSQSQSSSQQTGTQSHASRPQGGESTSEKQMSSMAIKEGGLPDTVGHKISKSVTSYQYTQTLDSNQTPDSTKSKQDTPVQKETTNTQYSQSMGNRGKYSHQMATNTQGQQTVFAEIEYVDTDAPNTDTGTQIDQRMRLLLEERRRKQELLERERLEAERPSAGRCTSCTVNGTSYKGHSRFVHTSGCYKMRCICKCDGSYSCPSEHTINTCTQQQQQQQQQKRERHQQPKPTNGCTPCTVDGTSYKGHSRFEYSSGCYKRRCICHCDGSHTCPSHQSVNTCKQEARSKTERRVSSCATCSAKGKIVNGNSYFDLRDGCTQYKSCICRCNGSWSCPSDRAENVCVTPQNRSTCKECEVYGGFYPGNSRFTYEEGCYEYNCDCNCDGTWTCPPNRTKDICHTGCGECEVQGEFFEGNAYFKQERRCVEYTCFCRCNGSYNCPSDQARNTCIAEDHTTCNRCQVSARESYPGNSTFDLRKKCIQYQCTCNCDGSWDCPGQLAKNICRGELPGKCKTCQVADNEYYPGDSDFEMRKDCIHYQCRCNCDGSWDCPGDQARDVCKGEVPGGCKSCRLSDTEFYRGDSDFEMRKKCIHYKCRCNCDGSWNCPGESARNICLGEVPGGCRSCKVDNGTIYPGNSRFQLTRDCNRFDCICKCNGSWSCPGHTAVNVCDAKRQAKHTYTCTDCVLEGKSYKGGKQFELVRGCYSYPCKCSCAGKWTCDTSNAKNTCTQPTNRPVQCNKCVVNGREHPGGSDFRIRRGCISYQCRCACDGRWECPSDRASNFCPGAREPTDSCKPCIVDRTNYKSGENFDIKRGCVRYRCQCRCDGSYGCHVTEDTACGAGELPAKCGNCVIDGYVYPGNMGFLTRSGCIQKACQCNCDGTYDCPNSAIQNICTGEATYQNRESQLRKTSNTGMWPYRRGMGTNRNHTQTVVTNRHGGQLIPGAAVPSHTNSGTNYYTSDGQKVVSHGQYVPPIGPDGTQRVVANSGGQYFAPHNVPVNSGQNSGTGQKQYYYQGGKEFVPRGGQDFYSKHITDPRTVYTQTVHSQSSSSHQRPFPPLPRSSQTYVHSKQYSTNRGCQNCTIDGNSYVGNTDFQVTKKCIQYQCRCDCSGMWSCSGEYSWSCTPRNGPLSGDCRSCVVKEVEYPPNHTFSLKQGCSEYECQCNCDGRWFCPTQKPKDICGPNAPQHEQPSKCHTCLVKDTEYPADSEFFLNENCKQYTCTCSCDGSWNCPDSKTVNICQKQHKTTSDIKTSSLKDNKSTDDDQLCKPCQVNGKSYMATKNFQFREGCSKYKCHCFCNGTWECPANDTVNMCRSPDYRIDGCKNCAVRNETYPGGTAFRYREGCWEFNCFCGCNGEWDCPHGSSTDLCKTTGGISSRCRPCIINGKVIKSKSVFNIRTGCNEFLCDCKCDGSHECPPERSLNICEENHITAESGVKPNFKGCEIGNRQFFTRLFVYTEDCIQYMCICYDNGAWKCPPNKSRRVC